MRQNHGFLDKWLLNAYLWATELLYHSFAWAYDAVAWLVSFGNWSQWRLDALSYLKQGAVLETGYGTGELLIEMTALGYDVTGLELSTQMQRVTGRKLRGKGVSVRRVTARTEAIPFPDSAFENVLSTFPSGYIAREDTLREIRRILTVQGRLVIIGLGVRFKAGVKRWLTGWFLWDASGAMVQNLSATAKNMGFEPTIIEHETDAYILPILILERDNVE